MAVIPRVGHYTKGTIVKKEHLHFIAKLYHFMRSPDHIADALLNWFDRHGRKDLPWQQDRTPYRVWVSEIMLQQTQVTTVIPYYQRFMTALPSVEDLAAATEDTVLHLWTGLGYYARARNLHRCAREICREHKGQFPTDLAGLEALPGIGRSTAGAILSLAMQTRAPILDGNVKRVLARYHAVEGWPGQRAVSDQLWRHAEHHTPQERVADFTQAIMDLGATCCTRSQPNCGSCPLHDGCMGRQRGRQGDFPGRKPRKEIPQRRCWLAVVTRSPGEVLLEKRPASGIWGGLWAPPEFNEEAVARAWIENIVGLPGEDCRTDAPFHHGFTHFKLEAHPVRAHCETNRADATAVNIDADELQWFSLHPPPAVGLPAPVLRLLIKLGAETL